MERISLQLYVEADLQLRPDCQASLDSVYDYRRHPLEARQAVDLMAMLVLFIEDVLNFDGFADFRRDWAGRAEKVLDKSLSPNHPTLAPGISGKEIVLVSPRQKLAEQLDVRGRTPPPS